MNDYLARREEYKHIVLEALEEMHWELGIWRSFRVDEIAERAGVDLETARQALEDLRRD